MGRERRIRRTVSRDCKRTVRFERENCKEMVKVCAGGEAGRVLNRWKYLGVRRQARERHFHALTGLQGVAAGVPGLGPN